MACYNVALDDQKIMKKKFPKPIMVANCVRVVGGGGTQVQMGGRTFVTYFAEEGVFF